MTGVLVAAAIVVGIGLITGIILAVASKAFYVPVDKRVEDLIEVLPGANCGACGFAGCADYASALVEKPDTLPNLCPVGGASVAGSISEVLGVDAGEFEAKVAAVMCMGNLQATRKIMENPQVRSCKAAVMFYGGSNSCVHGCLGLGDCVSECKYDAIRISNGVAVVDRDLCVGCGACVKACPKEIIDMISEKSRIFVACSSIQKGARTRKDCANGCIGCMKCQKVCKCEAIEVKNNLAKIAYDKCDNCGLCEKECPTGAIVKLRKPASHKPINKM